jgi:hypothetical protein
MLPEDSNATLDRQTEEPPIYCEEARRLLKAFGAAVHELVKLNGEQSLAIVEGDLTANRFDLLIHYANEKKQNAKYAYLTHLEQHGCSQTTKTSIRSGY